MKKYSHTLLASLFLLLAIPAANAAGSCCASGSKGKAAANTEAATTQLAAKAPDAGGATCPYTGASMKATNGMKHASDQANVQSCCSTKSGDKKAAKAACCDQKGKICNKSQCSDKTAKADCSKKNCNKAGASTETAANKAQKKCNCSGAAKDDSSSPVQDS